VRMFCLPVTFGCHLLLELSQFGRSALHLAVVSGAVDIVAVLIRSGADVNVANLVSFDQHVRIRPRPSVCVMCKILSAACGW
jgi:hypothetical protein